MKISDFQKLQNLRPREKIKKCNLHFDYPRQIFGAIFGPKNRYPRALSSFWRFLKISIIPFASAVCPLKIFNFQKRSMVPENEHEQKSQKTRKFASTRKQIAHFLEPSTVFGDFWYFLYRRLAHKKLHFLKSAKIAPSKK